MNGLSHLLLAACIGLGGANASESDANFDESVNLRLRCGVEGSAHNYSSLISDNVGTEGDYGALLDADSEISPVEFLEDIASGEYGCFHGGPCATIGVEYITNNGTFALDFGFPIRLAVDLPEKYLTLGNGHVGLKEHTAQLFAMGAIANCTASAEQTPIRVRYSLPEIASAGPLTVGLSVFVEHTWFKTSLESDVRLFGGLAVSRHDELVLFTQNPKVTYVSAGAQTTVGLGIDACVDLGDFSFYFGVAPAHSKTQCEYDLELVGLDSWSYESRHSQDGLFNTVGVSKHFGNTEARAEYEHGPAHDSVSLSLAFGH